MVIRRIILFTWCSIYDSTYCNKR